MHRMSESGPPPSPTQDDSAVGSHELAITIYQLAGDGMFKFQRSDGTGFDWAWADWQRDWMDRTPNKFAYRCLPLTMANQTGMWVFQPVGFTAVWNGHWQPGNVQFIYDSDPGLWSQWINDQFGEGIITWNVPFLFRTQPAGTRLLVTGPTNYFKHGIQPLTAIVESDWIYMSFTMNWKITSSKLPIRFDVGEPLLQVIPLASNVFADIERARVTYMHVTQDPPVLEAYKKWRESRLDMVEQKKARVGDPRAWQKDYFAGRDILGSQTISGHKTKITFPPVDNRKP
jgi:hypothetical protein